MKNNLLASLILAKVIKNKYNGIITNCSINDEQFYCDFLTHDSISNKDFLKIQKEMGKIINNKVSIKNITISKEEAKKINHNNKFILEEINEINDHNINFFIIDDLYILNKDVNIKNNTTEIKEIKFFELENIGGIYWKGDSKNQQLTRIYGYSFTNEQEFLKYKEILNERKERDHRKIGSELELFTFDLLAGQGLPIWLPKGTAIKKEIENFIYDILVFNDYNFVQTPVLGSVDLYKISGHWSHYRDSMFSPVEVEGETMVLRPMTCPHHMLVYKSKPRSYRDLPYRIAEHAILHRYEASGALTGFERVRSMQLVDTHLVVRQDQIASEIERSYNIIKKCHEALGTSIFRIDLSLHDPKDKDKFFDNPKMWQNAEKQLKEALDKMGFTYREMVGEAAFYGPKIDMQVKTALGHIITVSTIQLDFLLPERFELKYIDKNNKEVTPILIHGGIIGTFERFMAILLEQTKGVLPTWLAPIQVAIIPIIEKHKKFAEEINWQLKKVNIRTKLFDSDERVGKKIRESQIQKIPYQIVVGDNEIENNKISYRLYGSEEVIVTDIESFIHLIKQKIYSKK